MTDYEWLNTEGRRRGIDHDLVYALQTNPQNFAVEDIATVLAVSEGQPDGDDWHWIARLENGQLLYLRGGCDYSGWGCQDWLSAEEVPSVEAALLSVRKRSWDGEDEGADAQTVGVLRRQLELGKEATRREALDKTFDRLYIYVAGPYTAKDDEGHVANVNRAIEGAWEVLKRGHIPFIPHLTHYFDAEMERQGRGRLPWELYMAWDDAWLDKCNALLYLASSRGADIELARALNLGLLIFYSVDDIPVATIPFPGLETVATG